MYYDYLWLSYTLYPEFFIICFLFVEMMMSHFLTEQALFVLLTTKTVLVFNLFYDLIRI